MIFTYLTRKSLCEIRYRDGHRRWRLSWLTNRVATRRRAQARLFRADAGLTALKRLYKGAAGSPVPLSAGIVRA
ncbi:Hok/Gef family protein [Escherichia coli]|nr:Hok/Gef family protein [Escherichia coli]